MDKAMAAKDRSPTGCFDWLRADALMTGEYPLVLRKPQETIDEVV